MISKLLNYYDKCHCYKQGMILDLVHDSCAGWQIRIYDRVRDKMIFESDNTSLNLLAAQAYIALAGWADEFDDICDIECNLNI